MARKRSFSPSLSRSHGTGRRRAAGSRFNKLLQHWEDRDRLADAEALATAYGGAVRRVAGVLSPVVPAGQSAE
jgi:hypothetical protein